MGPATRPANRRHCSSYSRLCSSHAGSRRRTTRAAPSRKRPSSRTRTGCGVRKFRHYVFDSGPRGRTSRRSPARVLQRRRKHPPAAPAGVPQLDRHTAQQTVCRGAKHRQHERISLRPLHRPLPSVWRSAQTGTPARSPASRPRSLTRSRPRSSSDRSWASTRPRWSPHATGRCAPTALTKSSCPLHKDGQCPPLPRRARCVPCRASCAERIEESGPAGAMWI